MNYGPAMKQRVMDLYDQGERTCDIARRLCVSRSWCRRVKQRRHEPPATMGGSQPKLDHAARQTLLQWVQQAPDATLQELRDRVARDLAIEVCVGTIWSTLRDLGLSLETNAAAKRAASA